MKCSDDGISENQDPCQLLIVDDCRYMHPKEKQDVV